MVTCSRILISKFQFQNFGSLMHMGLVLSSVQNFKLIWLWTIFVTNCFKFLVVLVIWMMACYFSFWCLRLIVMFAFWQKIYKKMFSYVLHTANTLTCFERFFIYKKYWKFWKMCFRMDFLNTTKNCYLAFWDFTTCL